MLTTVDFMPMHRVFGCSVVLKTDNLESHKDSFVKNLSMFFMKLSRQLLIPDSTIELIAQEMLNINSLNQLYIKESVSRKLVCDGMAKDTIDSMHKALDESDLLDTCLKDSGILSGVRQCSNFAKKNFLYVEPRSIFVDFDSKNQSRFCQYIPVKESISILLQDPSVLRQCTDSVSAQLCPTDLVGLKNFTDGLVYRNCIAQEQGEKILSLILYQDSFELVNPLGSAKKKQKMLAVYFVLGNLKLYNRSRIDHTQLVLLVRVTDADCIGLRIFKPLVDDLKILEDEGIDVSGERWLVRVVAIAGDNLGSHWLGEFTTNFSSSQHICRFCTLTRSDFDRGCISAAPDQFRTPDKYSMAVSKVSPDVPLVDGIKQQSIFNELKYFHVCAPGLPPCAAHDLFEEIVVFDIPLFLQHFVKLKLFSVQQQNQRIQHLQLSGSD